MARSNRPIKAMVHPYLMKEEAVQELVEKGNHVDEMTQVVYAAGTLDTYDLVIGMNCWRIVPGMEDQIKVAIKAARKQKYGKKGEDGDD